MSRPEPPAGGPYVAPSAGLYVGLDVGTSGVRAVAIDADGRQQGLGTARLPWPAPRVDPAERRQSPAAWWHGVEQALAALFTQVAPSQVRSIAVDGTSGTVLVTDSAGHPLSEGWMYDDASCTLEAAQVARQAPPESAAHGASSPLARLLRLQRDRPEAVHLLHQADWIAGTLCGQFGFSDSNNALKLGYDALDECWPVWFDALGVRRDWLPQVQRPGSPVALITALWAARFGLPSTTQIVAGTTDGVAAFLATGASEVGDGVTSLGSTLVLKVLSSQPVSAPAYGIYSHRLGNLWLPGGASNSGGAALLAHFSPERMAQLTPLLQPERPTGLDYYPLPSAGERFPINDPTLAPRETPRPADDAQFFQALLEGIANVERLAFERIAELGAPFPKQVFTVGGGARNAAWTRLRQQRLGVPVVTPLHEDAGYGTALLARQGAGVGA